MQVKFRLFGDLQIQGGVAGLYGLPVGDQSFWIHLGCNRNWRPIDILYNMLLRIVLKNITMLQNIWNYHFHKILHNKYANKNILAFYLANYSSPNEKYHLWNLPEEPDDVILSVSPITGNIKSIHDLSNLGVSRSYTKDKIDAVEGRIPEAQTIIIEKRWSPSTDRENIPTAKYIF